MPPLPRFLAHWLACKEATRLISQLQEREASPLERFKLRAHLSACDACAAFERQVQFLRVAMRRYRS
jgi:hypothetical protein